MYIKIDFIATGSSSIIESEAACRRKLGSRCHGTPRVSLVSSLILIAVTQYTYISNAVGK